MVPWGVHRPQPQVPQPGLHREGRGRGQSQGGWGHGLGIAGGKGWARGAAADGACWAARQQGDAAHWGAWAHDRAAAHLLPLQAAVRPGGVHVVRLHPLLLQGPGLRGGRGALLGGTCVRGEPVCAACSTRLRSTKRGITLLLQRPLRHC